MENEKQIKGMKRKREQPILLKRHSLETNPIESSKNHSTRPWVSASMTRNYLIGDPILDYLEMYGKQRGFHRDHEYKNFNEKYNITNYIMEQGNKFEQKVFELLKQRITKYQQVSYGDHIDSQNHQLAIRTKELIHRGVPMILHPVMIDQETKTCGVADLIVRSDYIHKLVDNFEQPKENHPLHYIVVDIKFSTLHLKANGIDLQNSGNMKAYKGQLVVYNRILAKYQGYLAPHAYILGRKWEYTKCGKQYRSNSCLDKLGRIDYQGADKDYYQMTDKAIQFYRKLVTEGNRWGLDNKLIRPNISNHNDTPWHYAKKEIAKRTGEITQIVHGGNRNRKGANEQGKNAWYEIRDPEKELGIKGKKYTELIRKIIRVNKSRRKVEPRKIKNNNFNWKEKERLEFFVDFETVTDINDTFEDLPYSKGTPMIYMIGCGYQDPYTEKWIFRNFVANQLKIEEESRIVKAWYDYMELIQEEFQWGKYQITDYWTPKIFHWGDAEEIFLRTAIARNKELAEKLTPNFINLHKIFKSEPIVVNGAFDYRLKTIAVALKELKFIETDWGNSSVDGIGSMVAAFCCDKLAKEKQTTMKEIKIMQEIEQYNEIDCKVMWEILEFLRNHFK